MTPENKEERYSDYLFEDRKEESALLPSFGAYFEPEKKYPSCTARRGLWCSKHGVIHKKVMA